ncbi:sporulation protein [Cohnella fermenti]|uniref:sporulation protein n=1 Tax=Cohnella fermenti TaxID=2565925 RepID=UPI001454D1DE|nr:sporulation protein [Cohnella fermenti]
MEQQVDDVYAYVMTRYLKEQNDSKFESDAVISRILLAGGFTVEAEQVYEFPVSLHLPVHTSVTLGRTQCH